MSPFKKMRPGSRMMHGAISEDSDELTMQLLAHQFDAASNIGSVM